MARLRTSVERVTALHSRAVARADEAQRGLDRYRPDDAATDLDAEQRALVADLTTAAARLVPGWLGAALDVAPPRAVPGAGAERPGHVRIGVARPLAGAEFPVIVPTGGHLAIDAQPGDPRARALLRSVVLRLIAAYPVGALRLRVVDATGLGFASFEALYPAGLMSEPVTGVSGLRAVLGEAEQWVRQPDRRYTLLLVITCLPAATDPADLARVAALAGMAPGTGLCLMVAGWPPEPGSSGSGVPLPHSTSISLRHPYPLVGDPPGGSFGAGGSLGTPVELDPDPPATTVRSVCERVAGQMTPGGSTLAELLPDQAWQESSADGLAMLVGRAGGSPLTLRLSDLTPHWLVGGRTGSGKSAFLLNVLYGLCTRYGPDQLTLYLLDFKEGVSFTEFVPTDREPTWIPQVRAVGVESDRQYGLAVLRELDAEMAVRADRYKEAGVSRFAELRRSGELPRIVCVIDEFQVLVQGSDRLARESLALLESLARKGRSYGIHLILASQTARGVESLYAKRDSIFGQFPVRIALPGGADVLDPLNQAAGLVGLGEAIVNTAGGLGGPSGASRAHERRVEFPDPHADSDLLTTVRRRLWDKRPDDHGPYVFYGQARAHLPALLPASPARAAYLGRRIDVPLSLATFALDAAPGRHLAVLGPSELGADLLDAAARSLAAQHRPGTVHFVLAPLVAAVEPVTARLAADLAAAGHRVTASRRLECPEQDGYLFGFGLDGAAPGSGLSRAIREGPARGVHVFGWWRGLRRFVEDSGGRACGDVAGLVLLNIPSADASALVGDVNLDWQPRPNRALLHDRHTGRTEVIVPFVHRGRSA